MPRTVMNPRVFWGASAIVVALLAAAVLAPGASDVMFEAAQAHFEQVAMVQRDRSRSAP